MLSKTNSGSSSSSLVWWDKISVGIDSLLSPTTHSNKPKKPANRRYKTTIATNSIQASAEHRIGQLSRARETDRRRSSSCSCSAGAPSLKFNLIDYLAPATAAGSVGGVKFMLSKGGSYGADRAAHGGSLVANVRQEIVKCLKSLSNKR